MLCWSKQGYYFHRRKSRSICFCLILILILLEMKINVVMSKSKKVTRLVEIAGEYPYHGRISVKI